MIEESKKRWNGILVQYPDGLSPRQKEKVEGAVGACRQGAPNGVTPLKRGIQQPGRGRSRLVSSFDADDLHCNEMQGESYADGMGASSSSSSTISESGARSLSTVAAPRHRR